jgi:hypothetical protein
MQIEIIGTDGTVHYTRPHDHPDVWEALNTAGYSVRGTGENRASGSLQPGGCAALVEIISDLLMVIREHHSDNVMRDDRYICPVCSDKGLKLVIERAAAAEAQHNHAISETRADKALEDK